MAQGEKEYKGKADMLRDGAILQAYGTKYVLSVNPAPGIDKCRFSVVELGTKGKVSIDYWMKMDEMRRLCDEIDKGIAARKINDDAQSQYPSAYTFVTGENGSKKLSIGGGQKGCRVQVQVNRGNRWDRMMTVISYADLQDMAFYFKLVMGLIPATRYYGSLVDAYWQGESERQKNFGKEYREELHDREDRGYNAYADQPAQQQVQTQERQQKAEPEAPVQNNHQQEEVKELVYALKTAGCMVEKEKIVAISCTDGKEQYILIFQKDQIPSLNWFPVFQERANQNIMMNIRVLAKRKGNYLQFVSVA